MATTTSKLALTKPDGTDLVDIAVLNANADKIDAASGATICTSTTRPASPWNGQVIFETDTLNALVYRTSTSSWAILGGSTVASDPPAGAGNGNFWWDSDNGKLYIYYNDGNSGQWVSVMPSQTQIVVSPNYLINGAFDIWQRGTSFSAPGYTADRWYFSYGGTVTVAQEATVVPPNATFSARVTTGAASSFGELYQALEAQEVNAIAGSTVTVSVFVRALASFSGNAVLSVQTNTTANTQTGGTWTEVASAQVTPSTSGFTRVSVTYVVPAGTRGLRVRLAMATAQASGTGLYWSQAQMELGSTATAFRRNANSFQGELAACQRYYEKSYAQSEAPGTATVTGQVTFYGTADGSGNIVVPVKFSTVKRTTNAYTVAVYNGSGVAGQMDWTRNGAGASGGATLYRANDAMFHAYVNVGSAWASCNGAMHWTCNAEL